MTKLFKTKPAHEKRTIRYPILLTEKEAETIRHAAFIRNLSVADFIRRAALGRKADVKYETEIVLALCSLVNEIKDMHAGITKNMKLPAEFVEWGVVIRAAQEAIAKINEI